MTAAAALLLLAVAFAVWFVAAGARAAARVQIRFAAVLFAAMGSAAMVLPQAATAVTLLVLPIGCAVLALAATAGFSKPLAPALAAFLLALVSLGGLAGALAGVAALALAPAALAILAQAAIFLRQFDARRLASVQGLLSALCLLGAASAFAAGGAGVAPLVFSAAGLLGAAVALSRSDVAVEEGAVRDLRGVRAIGGRRQA